MKRVVIVTHAGAPHGVADDHLLAEALRGQHAEVHFGVWSDPNVDWGRMDVAVIRSTWDYHLATNRWHEWVKDVSTATRLLNPADVILWNSDKRYLLDLEDGGIPIIPTLVVQREGGDLGAFCRDRDWNDVVVKPAVGASSHGAGRFAGNAIADRGQSHVDFLCKTGPALVQPYVPNVETDRERSIVFIGGSYSHAFTKPPFMSGLAQAELLDLVEATDAEKQFATELLSNVGDDLAYARVDILPTETGLVLMELELIEPHLGLGLWPAAAELLAAVVLKDGNTTH